LDQNSGVSPRRSWSVSRPAKSGSSRTRSTRRVFTRWLNYQRNLRW